jgi:AraC family transcriptional regulator, dual regulator of chb operon
VLPDATLPLVPGSLVLVAASDVHGFETAHAKGYSIFNLAVPQMYWTTFWKRYATEQSDPPDPFALPLAARSYQLEKSELAAVKQASSELRAGQRSNKALDRFLLNLFAILDELSPIATGFSPPAWLRKAIASCAASAEQLELGVAALVQNTGKSPEHISRECRKWLNKTPTDVVNELRLDHAANQLTHTNLSIVGIAQSVGFLNMSHFYRLFRTRFSLTPAEHRSAALRVLQP